ncbi:MAG: DUF4430 domain-containing protein [Candidatus Ranarchaeia archaeon]
MTSKAWIVTGIILIWAVGASGVGAYYYFQYTTTNDAYQKIVGEETIIASIGFDYGNGTIEWHNSTVIPFNSTVLYLTNQTAEITGKKYSFGFYLTGINDVISNASGNEKYWVYSVNGNYAMVGPDAYYLRFGDIVLWSYSGF